MRPSSRTTLAALALSAAGLAACAGTHGAPYIAADAKVASAKESDASCFRPDQITGFSAVGDKALNIRVNGSRVYQLDLMGSCPNIDWAMKAAIQSRSGGWVCNPLDAMVISPSPIGPEQCPVTAIRKLSPQEIAALPPRQRP